MGKNRDAAKKVAVPATEKKPRKQRAKMRTRKESPAGHFADRLAANAKQASDIVRAIAKYPGVEAGMGTGDLIAHLNDLAASGFVPARGRGGRTAVTFAPGQSVTVAPECVSMLKSLFVAAGIDGAEFTIAQSYSPQPKDKQIPLCANGSPVGFVSRKFVTA